MARCYRLDGSRLNRIVLRPLPDLLSQVLFSFGAVIAAEASGSFVCYTFAHEADNEA